MSRWRSCMLTSRVWKHNEICIRFDALYEGIATTGPFQGVLVKNLINNLNCTVRHDGTDLCIGKTIVKYFGIHMYYRDKWLPQYCQIGRSFLDIEMLIYHNITNSNVYIYVSTKISLRLRMCLLLLANDVEYQSANYLSYKNQHSLCLFSNHN